MSYCCACSWYDRWSQEKREVKESWEEGWMGEMMLNLLLTPAPMDTTSEGTLSTWVMASSQWCIGLFFPDLILHLSSCTVLSTFSHPSLWPRSWFSKITDYRENLNYSYKNKPMASATITNWFNKTRENICEPKSNVDVNGYISGC